MQRSLSQITQKASFLSQIERIDVFMHSKLTIHHLLLIIACAIVCIGCTTTLTVNKANASATIVPDETETFSSTTPVIVINTENTNAQANSSSTPFHGVRKFELNWQPIEAKLYHHNIHGLNNRFDPYGFTIFIPDIFNEIESLEYNPNRIAVYQTEYNDYTLSITKETFNYETNDLDDIASQMINDADKTVCRATINNLQFITIESYSKDTLQLITHANNFYDWFDENEYIVFQFEPMSNTKYTDLTISMSGSIRPMFPKDNPNT